jgi:hypothetical protein
MLIEFKPVIDRIIDPAGDWQGADFALISVAGPTLSHDAEARDREETA